MHLMIVVPFVVQIFAAVALTGWLSLRNGQKAVNNLATRLQEETAARIEQHLENYLATPQLINRINANAVGRGELQIRGAQSKRYLWEQIQLFESVSWIYYASEQDSEFIGVTRQGERRDLRVALNEKVNRYKTYYYTLLDADSNQAKLLAVNPSPYDPTTRPWYTAAAQSRKPVWSEIYPDFDTSQLVITASSVVYNDRGAIAGVVGVDLFLNDINQFLSNLKIGRTGETFIMERSGLLVASSTSEPPFLVNGDGNNPQRINASESNNPFIRATADYVTRNVGSLDAIDSQIQLEFVMDGDRDNSSVSGRQYLRVTAFKDDRGLDWLIFVVVPESDFMEQIHANTLTTIALCISALILATLLSLLTSSWITKPILRLSQASKTLAKQAASANFATIEPDLEINVRRANEIRVLAKSFNRMARQLQKSFVTLDQTNAELKAGVDQLKQVQLQLVQSEKMSTLGQLVAGVAHEINNPTSFIAGNLNYAQRYTDDLLHLLKLYQQHYPNPPSDIAADIKAIDLDFLADDLPKLLTSMTEGTNRIRDISKSLRNFSRADNSTKAVVNIHDGIDSTLMILKHRLKATETRLEINVVKQYSSLPLVKCYPAQLNQVFMNIIANAIDAFDEYEISSINAANQVERSPYIITIWTRLTQDHNTVVIGIRDNGPGMSEAVQEQVFDYQFTTKDVGKGTGLGLPISRQIVVEKHSGTLTVTSSLGQGTEFVIRIPVETHLL